MSTQQQSIYQLIPKVMREIGAVAKGRKNEQQKYMFRGIEDFYDASHPVFGDNGIFCAPCVLERTEYRFEKTNQQGGVTTWLHVALKVRHRFYASDGSFVDVETYGEGLDNSDKASNKAMSGAMKYALIETFQIPTKDVDDSDRSTPEQGTRRPAVPRIMEDIPLNGDRVMPSEDTLITSEQAEKLHMRFRQSLSDDLKPKAKALLHEWLGKKLYLDASGNPSARSIQKDEFANVGKAAVAWAKELSAA